MSNAGENCLTDALLMGAMDGELPPPETWRVTLHLESCETCQARLDQLRLVSSRVADFRRVALPPDAAWRFAALLEAEESRELRGAWWQWFARPRPLWQKLAWCGAFVVVILVGLRVRTAHPVSTVPQIVKSLPPAVAPHGPRQLVADSPAQPVRRAHHSRRKRVPPMQFSPPARAALREVTTPFFNLPFSDAALPLDQATVIPVELPRSALELAGLPVDEDRRNQRIRADLVLGADGLARAIRFVE